jgi:hypothetical protein
MKSGTSHQIVGGAIIVCLAVLVWLILVPLASLVLAEEPGASRVARRRRPPSRTTGRLIPVG